MRRNNQGLDTCLHSWVDDRCKTRDGLVQLRSAGHSAADIASRYGVSEALCAWRLRMTGVDVQIRRAYR